MPPRFRNFLRGARLRPRRARGGISRRRRPDPIFLSLLLLLIAIPLAGILLFAVERETVTEHQWTLLETLASDRVREIQSWRHEREEEAYHFIANRWYTDAIRDFLSVGKTSGAEWGVFRADVEVLLRRHLYEGVFVADPAGRIRFSQGETSSVFSDLPEQVHIIAQTHRITVHDHLINGPRGEEIRIVMLAPVFDNGKFIGALGFQIQPYIYSSPVVVEWPVIESTAEILVFRPQGSNIIYLTPRRYERTPVERNPSQEELANETINRGGGRLEGVDYRQERAIGVGAPIVGTPWFLVAKIDRDEAESVVRELALWTAGLALLFMGTMGLVMRNWLRKESAERRAIAYKGELDRQALTRHFDYLAKYANDIILLTDASGQIVEVNDRAIEAYGYSRAELLQMSMRDLRSVEAAEQFEQHWREAASRRAALFETVHRTRSGRLFTVESSVRVIDVDGRLYFQAIIRDISERKAAEERIRRLNDYYFILSQTNQAIVRARDLRTLMDDACRIPVERERFVSAFIASLSDDRRYLIPAAYHGPSPEEFWEKCRPPATDAVQGSGALARATREGRLFFSNDLRAEPNFIEFLAEEWAHTGVCSAAVIPFFVEGRIEGVLAVTAHEVGAFDPETLALLEEMAGDVGYAIGNLAQEQARRAAERGIRESEYRYRSLFENMGGAVVVLASENGQRFTIKDVNAALERIEGKRRGEVIGLTAEELFLAGCPFVEALKEVWQAGHPREIPACRLEVGGWRTGFVYKLPTEEMVVIYDDVTGSKESEEALRRSEERLASVLQATEDCYWDLDFRNRVAYFSPSFIATFDFPATELPLARAMQLFEGIIYPDDFSNVQQAYLAHLRGESAQFLSEHRARVAGGRWAWVRARGKVVKRTGRGVPLRMSGTHTDITERRRVGEQLRVWAKVFEHSREMILVTDADRRIIATNRAFSEITGFAEEEVKGRDPHYLSSGLEDRAFYEQMWRTIAERGHWQGEIRDRRKGGEIFPVWMAITAATDERGVLQNYIAIGSDISERKAAEEQIRFLAYHDSLTALPNRVLFQDRINLALAHAKRTHGHAAVLFVDLDRFKNINDSLGHQMGDRLLKAVAGRLVACVRNEDTVSRQSGDEFLLLLSELREADDAAQVANKILTELSRPFLLEEVEVHVTPSIGIAIYPEDGEDADTLIRNADAAMYYAKERGRNNFQFFVSELNRRVLARLSLENALRHAVIEKEFELHYQPQVSTRSGEVVAVEALLRWRRDGTLVQPSEFVHVAEETGLIIPIGEWVVREACRQLTVWREEGLPKTRVAVNLSGAQFQEQGALERLRAVMVEACVEPGCLEVELTEGVLMEDAESSIRSLNALKSAGIRLSVDDFGTGYSSLNYLRRFPIDRLKVDQSFVRDLPTDATDRAVTEAIIALARILKVSVVAEGVETEEEMRLLEERDCDELQGYYFTPPLPANQFRDWWRERLTSQ